ncbi:MAG: class I SAM-dependent methyltransferase [Gemmataceae bacterium]|nr:class I SAM-dependent methyltransferase [Gemmataceae bacterium]
MPGQDHFWSEAARDYEAEFVDPYRPDVRNPLLKVLGKLAARGAGTVADLGCGIGPLLPFLAEHFRTVYAVDFAEGMLARARERCQGLTNVEFVQRDLTDLGPLAGRLDVAVAINSLVLPVLSDLEEALRQIRASLKPGGRLLAIVPAMDAVHYYTMLLLDRALAAGKPPEAARKNAAHHADHATYDFAFGQFRYKGLEQHFWQPFEIRYRLRRAGFGKVRLARVWLAWEQFACGGDLKDQPPPWDWFVYAR